MISETLDIHLKGEHNEDTELKGMSLKRQKEFFNTVDSNVAEIDFDALIASKL